MRRLRTWYFRFAPGKHWRKGKLDDNVPARRIAKKRETQIPTAATVRTKREAPRRNVLTISSLFESMRITCQAYPKHNRGIAENRPKMTRNVYQSALHIAQCQENRAVRTNKTG